MPTDNPSGWSRERKIYLAVGLIIILFGVVMILVTR
jgi:hypothetical protein